MARVVSRLGRIMICVGAFMGGYILGMLAPALPAKEDEGEGRTWFELRASPRISVASDKPLYLMAYIRGDESEEFYCPKIELEIDGERVSTRESDCPSFDNRDEFPRYWVWYWKRVQGDHTARVTLLRAGRVIARAEANWSVQ